jgi:hypothetical protein
MQRDEDFTLAGGRRVSLQWVRVSRTFLEFVDGTPERCSAHVRAKWREKAELRGWQVIDPHGDVLPAFQCVASLKSDTPARIAEWHYSSLDVCWFVESVDVNLRELVANVLPHVDWEHRAIDGSGDDW